MVGDFTRKWLGGTIKFVKTKQNQELILFGCNLLVMNVVLSFRFDILIIIKLILLSVVE